MDNSITTLEMCAGYGGIGLGLKNIFGERLRTIAYCELEGFAQANLKSKMEKGLLDVAPIWSDLKTFPYRSFHGMVDILIAGYPCQPFSAAGKRAGKDDPRHLWPFIADGIRILRPRMCFFENVEGHISLGLREVIGELESIGYQTAWGIFSASEVGAPHQRKRVFILAYDKSLGIQGDRPIWLEESRPHAGQALSVRGGDAGGRELADAVCNGSGESWPVQQGPDGTKPISDGESRRTWPSRPGEPQHGWEPPRVVANSEGKRAGQRSELRSEECRSRSALSWDVEQPSKGVVANDHRPHAGHGEQRPERTPRDLSGGCGESGGTEGLAHTHGGRGEEPRHKLADILTEPSGGDGEAMGNATDDGRQHDKQSTNGRGAAAASESSSTMGNAESRRAGGCGNKDSEREGLGFIGTSPSGGMGDTEQLLLPTSREHGTMDEASGIPTDGEGRESPQTDPESSATREREGDGCNASECSEIKFSMGDPAYGTKFGVGLSELSGLSDSELAEICHWMVKTDNRTDELRLLGNGVVPATAERAFLTLWEELLKGTN